MKVSFIDRLFGRGVSETRHNPDQFSITANLVTDDHWQTISGRRHDRSWSEIQEIYMDALTAWRKNPLAWRMIHTTCNFVLGTGITFTSPYPEMDRFIQAFWTHRKNQMDLRLYPMIEELSRSGDLFVLLFRNTLDGISFVRFITKDQILKIDTAPNDWETELVYYEAPPAGEVHPRRWLSFEHPEAGVTDAVMLHYAVNKPMGALMGESDLTPIIPWLLRYSRMLEDRVRLHWAARAFLYLVTVPSNKVEAKSVQYGSTPESGSIVVKDESETWETITPSLRGADAGHDMRAVRNMIDAGSGYPPHWRGEGGEVNFATAQAMQAPPEKFLIKRQQYFVWLLEDIIFKAFLRAVEIGLAEPIPDSNYKNIFTAEIPDVTLRDNDQLSKGALQIANSFAVLQNILSGRSPTMQRIAADLMLKFSGEPQADEILDRIISEARMDPIEPILSPRGESVPSQGGGPSKDNPDE